MSDEFDAADVTEELDLALPTGIVPEALPLTDEQAEDDFDFDFDDDFAEEFEDEWEPIVAAVEPLEIDPSAVAKFIVADPDAD